MVFADDAMIPPALKDLNDKTQPGLPKVPAMPGDKTSDEGWYYDMGQNKLFVNLGGRVPGKDVQEVAAAPTGHGRGHDPPVVRSPQEMEIRRFNERASGRTMPMISWWKTITSTIAGQDSGAASFPAESSGETLSRTSCTIAMNVGDARGTIIEGNLIKRFHVNPFKTNSVQASYYSAAIMCNVFFRPGGQQ